MGPGLSQAVRMNIAQKFTIDCTKAGIAPLDVAVKGPRGNFLLVIFYIHQSIPYSN